ncbi:DUF6883 domain-containing protein [Methylobacterium organophilum]|uniref:DUF6883 domain-containing protein n=1 Tax=Methylobacterium organophilum TaxID=410 RepID=UPI001EE254D7|nr:DUF6883 domain-containing protein [Methylobacterium organophilum]
MRALVDVQGEDGEVVPAGSTRTVVAVWRGGLGFDVEFVRPVEALALCAPQALAAHPTPHTLTRAYPTPFGHRYHFEGPLPCPDGSVANVRTVWQVDADSGPHPARFITLKPLPRSR